MYLTAKQVAEKLKRSENTIYNWLKTNKIKGEKVNGKWQILASAIENLSLPNQEEVAAKETVTLQVAEHIANLECIHDHMESFSKALQDIQATAIAEAQKAQEQKKKEIEILSRVVKNQKQLKDENVELKKQNLFLQASVRKIIGQLSQLKKENELLKQRIEKVDNSQDNSYDSKSLPTNSKELRSDGSSSFQKSRSTPIKSEERAEKWARNNIHEWFQKPCKTGQLSEFTYEEIALNKAPKANINGNMQPSRAYLHVLAKKGTTWVKYKAIVALEITADKKEMYSKAYNHYSHPNEIGG